MMEVLRLSENVSVTVTHTDPWHWPQHPTDEKLGLPKFITYIGLDNKRLLSTIVARTPPPSVPPSGGMKGGCGTGGG